ncbi:MAG TPA: hypothetical protein VKU91_07430 [Acidimicrobiales bacterium]|nr:hypothetical protein [Acidimicrobiales bacterium]
MKKGHFSRAGQRLATNLVIFAVGVAALTGAASPAYSFGKPSLGMAKDATQAIVARAPAGGGRGWSSGPTLTSRLSAPLRPLRPTSATASGMHLAAATSSGTAVTFDGLSNTASRLPADPDVAANGSYVVEIAEPDFQIFSTSGQPLTAPTASNSLWAPMHNACSVASTGDWSQVLYDQPAGRWVYARSIHPTVGGVTYSTECLAVSQTSDPTGSWYLYSLGIGAGAPYSDYPQFAVWSNAYFLATNMWSGSGGSGTYEGDQVVAFDRAEMLAGQPVQTVRMTTTSRYETLVPATLEGGTLPPAATPEYLLGGPSDFESTGSSIEVFTVDVNFASPGASSWSGPYYVPVIPYNLKVCSAAGDACAAQPGTTVKLQAFTDNVMLPVGYRNLGAYQSITASFAVAHNNVDAIEWLELRNSGNGFGLYQQGVYSPTSAARYNESIAMDGAGDIALAYSLSSSSIYPSLAYTGRAPTDPPGAMTLPETVLWSGTGSQTSTSRWGDASYLAVAPDGCTFWYAGEYYPTSSASGWHTRIGSFQYPGCTVQGASR